MSSETELEVLKTVVSKLDASLEKMSDVSTNIGKILAVHEQRIETLEKFGEDRFDDVKELHSRITSCNREILDRIQSMEDRLELKFQKQTMQATQQHSDIQKELQRDIDEISKRLQKLENWRWWMMGIGVGLGIALAKVVPMMM